MRQVLTISLLSLFCAAIIGFVVSLFIFASKARQKEVSEGIHRFNVALKDKVGRLRKCCHPDISRRNDAIQEGVELWRTEGPGSKMVLIDVPCGNSSRTDLPIMAWMRF